MEMSESPKHISGGFRHAIITTASGIYGMGDNNFSQLGIKYDCQLTRTLPLTKIVLPNIKKAVCTNSSTILIMQNNDVVIIGDYIFDVLKYKIKNLPIVPLEEYTKCCIDPIGIFLVCYSHLSVNRFHFHNNFPF